MNCPKLNKVNHRLLGFLDSSGLPTPNGHCALVRKFLKLEPRDDKILMGLELSSAKRTISASLTNPDIIYQSLAGGWTLQKLCAHKITTELLVHAGNYSEMIKTRVEDVLTE